MSTPAFEFGAAPGSRGARLDSGMTNSGPLLALLHHSFGPYHVARARSLCTLYPGRVRLIRLAKSESPRAWEVNTGDLEIETVVAGVLDEASSSEVAAGLDRVLGQVRPDVLAVAGYGDANMRHATRAARRLGARTILMSDSQARDWPRKWWRERLKRRWVSRHFDAAFVSGASAASYVESLGIPAHRIWRGYDVVDNRYFATQANAAREDVDRLRESWGLPRNFFLFVGRFIPEKNLPRLIDGFRAVAQRPSCQDWGLVLVGSGPLEEALRAQAAALGGRVHFLGFQQADKLPSLYALASALVLPSVSESWGLTANEAMACGLPVIVSSQCGCAADLVFPGVNGFIVDPRRADSLAAALDGVASDPIRRHRYGVESTRIIQSFSTETWSQALMDCAGALS
jgi:1,2-diacylglycerol 3-alpha-glucosyltransferase